MTNYYTVFCRRRPNPWLFVFVQALLGICLSLSAQAQITGTVFRDFNSNGTYEAIPGSGAYTYGEPGVAGIIVRAYNSSGAASGSAVSGSSGAYSLTPSGSGPYRIEFSLPATLRFLNESFAKTAGSGTSVQFASTGTATLNFGVSDSKDYCEALPLIAVPCYVSGDPLPNGSGVADEVAMVSVPYNSSGTALVKSMLATAAELGSVFGVAYQRETEKLFSAAFLKRHAGLGSAGLGGIYVTDISGSAATNAVYIDLENAPFNLDLGQSGLTGRSLPTNGTSSSNDPQSFSLVGTVGLGGLALSTNGATLYVVDLKNKNLLAIAIGNPAKSSFVASDLVKIPIPDPNCTNGKARPFAVEVKDGKVFVGVVCSGEDGGTASNLRAFVYAMAEGATTFPTTAVLSFPLNYTRGRVHTDDSELGGNWETWAKSFSEINLGEVINPTASGSNNNPYPYYRRVARPQPILSDITFADNGDMIVAFMDRGGHQLGFRQRNLTQGQPTQTSSTTMLNGYIGGELLRAAYNGTTWVLENNGVVGSLTTGGTGPMSTTQGPGGREFYYQDQFSGFLTSSNFTEIHQETVMGSAMSIPGMNQVVATVMDPLNTWTGGFSWFNNTNGDDDRRAELYRTLGGEEPNGSTLGKANGLGVIEALCSPSPIQIGNRVWRDNNDNGVQDANEPPLAGVVVQLRGPGVPTNTTAVTNSRGEYYFSNGTGTTGDGFRYGLTLTYGGSYSLTFPASYSTLSLSQKPNQDPDGRIDSKPAASGTVSFTLGRAGQNTFAYDAGYVPPQPCVVSLTATPGACNPATNRYTVTGTVNFTGTPGGTLTITDRVASFSTIVTTTVSVSAGATSVPFTLTGIVSGGRSHTVTASFSNSACGVQSQTYLSPVSCTAAPCVGTNLLQNPSFEQGFPVPPNGQQTQAPPPNWVGGTADNNPRSFAAPDGYAYGFSGDNGTMCQSVSATTGATYNLTFFAGVHQVNGQTVTLSFLNSSSAVVGTPSVFPVTHILESNDTFGGPYSLSGVAPANTTQVRVCAVSSAGTGFLTWTKIDNLCLTGSAAPCALRVTATPGACNPATNRYTVTGTVSLSNATAQSLTITDGSATQTVSVSAGQTSASFSLTGTGFVSNQSSHTVTVTSISCGTSFTTYSAPASCSAVLNVVVSPAVCNTATNNYTTTATVSLTNATAGTLTLTDNGATVGTISVTAGQPSATFTLTGVSGSSPASHSVIATLGTATASTTYATPASCTVCSLSITTGSLPAGQVGSAYAQTIQTSGGSAPLSFTVSSGSLPNGLTLNLTTGAISGTPTLATTVSFTVKVTDGKSCSAIVPLTITTSNAPVCSLTATATPTVCNTATNQYAVSGIVSATNATGTQSLTITANGSSTVVTMSGNGPVLYTLTGLNSDGAAKTVSIVSSATACGTASATYTAPMACTVAAPALAVLVATPVCNTATNEYTATGTVSLTNVPANATLTITDNGLTISSQALTIGQTSASFSVTGVSGSSPASRSVVATLTNGVTVSNGTTYAVPASCTVAPVCALSAVVTRSACNTATNAYSSTVVVTLNNPVSGTVSITQRGITQTFSTTSTASQNTFTAIFNGLESDGLSYVVTAGLTDCGVTSASYTAPVACTVAVPTYTLTKQVSRSVAKIGDVISYTVIVTNTSSVSATNVVVTDELDGGMAYNTATPSSGVFTPGPVVSGSATVGTWTIPTLPASGSATLVMTATVQQAGIRHNVATLDNITAKTCTTVPFVICKGTDYLFRLQVETGYSSYQWYKDGQPIANATTNILDVTQAGSYSLTTGQSTSVCVDFSCCPFIVEEAAEVPVFSVTAVEATCTGTTPQANGQILLTNAASLTAYQYQISPGTSFSASTALAPATGIPSTGILVSNLAAPGQNQSYTVRLTDRLTGCERDVVVVLPPTACVCPAVCLPVTIRKVR